MRTNLLKNLAVYKQKENDMFTCRFLIKFYIYEVYTLPGYYLHRVRSDHILFVRRDYHYSHF
jgi:hypothetical protein